jgi:hypothetical protein
VTDAGGLTRQRCATHWQREAVARCPECRRYFCRECVTEHEDRVICASCLSKQVQRAKTTRHPLRPVARAFHLFLAVIVLWLFFYYAGRALLSLPDSFHEGTLWEDQ